MEGWEVVAIFHKLAMKELAEKVTFYKNLAKERQSGCLWESRIQAEERAGKEILRHEYGCSIIGRPGMPAWLGFRERGGMEMQV